jgi:hypothetical protein
MNGQCMQVYEEVGLNISAQVSARLSLTLRPFAGDRCRPAPPPPLVLSGHAASLTPY